jgi:hypothetical protein
MNFITRVINIKESGMRVKFDSILTIVNRLIKYTMFISFKKITTASVLTYTILQELINNHRLSKNLSLTETSCSQASFENTHSRTQDKSKMLMTYHSQTDEQSEQMNQTVETYLRHYINKNQNN